MKAEAPARPGGVTMDGFPFSCLIEVRFRDVDAMNHVNNAVYTTYLEVARTRMWRQHMGFAGSARDIPFIVARVAIDFRSPIDLADEVTVGIGVRRIGRTSFTLAYRVEASGRLAADAESVQVIYDYGAGRAVPVDAALRASLEPLLLQRERPEPHRR